jgi:TRAP-type C4-dicarboxylate transport system permease small subunit
LIGHALGRIGGGGTGQTTPVVRNKGGKVSGLKIVAILLIAAGIIGLLYGGFTYTKTTHNTKIGPLELSIKDKETVNVPIWAGVGAIVVGGILLFVRTKP